MLFIVNVRVIDMRVSVSKKDSMLRLCLQNIAECVLPHLFLFLCLHGPNKKSKTFSYSLNFLSLSPVFLHDNLIEFVHEVFDSVVDLSLPLLFFGLIRIVVNVAEK